MATEKQTKWRVRGRTLFEIKGIASIGFNAVERCKYCGKPATHEGLCEKCYNMVNY